MSVPIALEIKQNEGTYLYKYSFVRYIIPVSKLQTCMSMDSCSVVTSLNASAASAPLSCIDVTLLSVRVQNVQSRTLRRFKATKDSFGDGETGVLISLKVPLSMLELDDIRSIISPGNRIAY